MKTQHNLLDKYYKGDTSLEEEKELKNEVLSQEKNTAENDIFGYFDHEGKTPLNIEDEIFSRIITRQKKNKKVKTLILSAFAAAASIVILIGVYFNMQNQKNYRLENEFFVMEQALSQISESIQPNEQEDLLVLWVDEDVEIIIN